MRIVGVFENQNDVSFLVTALGNHGFDRGDMIISDLAKGQEFNTIEEAAQEISFVQTERAGFGEIESFASGIEGLKSDWGLVVAVKTPKHDADKVRMLMKQYGAVEIVQD